MIKQRKKTNKEIVQEYKKTISTFAYFINELNNAGVLTFENTGKMLSCMEQHNTKPWKQKHVDQIICAAYEIVRDENLA